MKTWLNRLWFPVLVAVICGLLYYFDKPILWIIETAGAAAILYIVVLFVQRARSARTRTGASVENGYFSFKAFLSVTTLIGLVIYIAYLGYAFRENYGQVLWLIEIIYLAASIRIIGPEDIGAVIFLGIPVVNVTSGPVIVPLLLCELVLAPRTLIQKEFPAEQDKIYRDDGPLPEGKSPPIRITFAEGPTNSRDPLDRRVTQEVVLVGTFKISNLCRFLTAYGSVDEMLRQIEDTMVGQATDDLTVVSLGEAMRRKNHYSERIRSAVEERIRDVKGGVHVVTALIKGFGLSHDLNRALQAHAEATGQASATVTAAEAERTRLAFEGEGRGQAARATTAGEIEGRTDGLVEMAKRLGIDGSEVLAAETARGIASGQGSTVIVGTEGFTDLIGLARAMAGKKPNGGNP